MVNFDLNSERLGLALSRLFFASSGFASNVLKAPSTVNKKKYIKTYHKRKQSWNLRITFKGFESPDRAS